MGKKLISIKPDRKIDSVSENQLKIPITGAPAVERPLKIYPGNDLDISNAKITSRDHYVNFPKLSDYGSVSVSSDTEPPSIYRVSGPHGELGNQFGNNYHPSENSYYNPPIVQINPTYPSSAAPDPDQNLNYNPCNYPVSAKSYASGNLSMELPGTPIDLDHKSNILNANPYGNKNQYTPPSSFPVDQSYINSYNPDFNAKDNYTDNFSLNPAANSFPRNPSDINSYNPDFSAKDNYTNNFNPNPAVDSYRYQNQPAPPSPPMDRNRINPRDIHESKENIPSNSDSTGNNSIWEPINSNAKNIFESLTAQPKKEEFYIKSIPTGPKNFDVDQPVDTISKSWIPIEKMKEVAKHNPNFVKNIESLLMDKKIIGWKKSRGDGNCYYRAVITRYIEIIYKFYNPIVYLENFLMILSEAIKYEYSNEAAVEDYKNATIQVYQILYEMYVKKQNNPIDAFIGILELLENKDFDLNIVRMARLIAYKTLIDPNNRERFYNFITDSDANVISCSLLTMNEEAEGLILILLPIGLKCQVCQYNLFGNNINEQAFAEENRNIVIHIVRRSGHYDILYSIQEMELEQYNFNTSQYSLLKSIQRFN